MGLLGCYLKGSSSRIDDMFQWGGTRKYIAAFTTGCDENYVRTNLGTGFSILYVHPTDSSQFVIGIEVSAVEEPSIFEDPTNPANTSNGTACYWWDVTIEYGPVDPLTHFTSTGNPLNQPISYSFDYQVYEEALDLAWNPGTSAYEPLVNSAGDPFDPPVTREALRFVMRVAYNVTSYAPATFAAYGDMINSDVWNGFPIGSVKVSPPKMNERPYSQVLNSNYYRIETEFVFYTWPSAWNANPIDRGFRALNGSGVPYKIVDVNGQPISQPALLNGSGGVLTSLSGYYAFNYQKYVSTSFGSAFPALTSLFP